jgi:hypothetical protein
VRGETRLKTDLISKLSEEERTLLLEALFSQGYAKEIVGSELSDIEKSDFATGEEKYRSLSKLFDRL